MEYKISKDISLLRNILSISSKELAESLNVAQITLERIENEEIYPNEETISKIYNFAYKRNLRLNLIKEMFYREDNPDSCILCHGSRTSINGEISPNCGRNNTDFGKGFYCGETVNQVISYIFRYPNSSLYILKFNKTDDLNHVSFTVNEEWMLAIAYFRGMLNDYENHRKIKPIIEKVKNADVIYAPIADNRMFDIINQFIEGYITDKQCEYSLAATYLGHQYVFLTEKAVSRLEILEKCYVCQEEKSDYLEVVNENFAKAEQKVKFSYVEFKSKGKYIGEILK